MILRAIRDVSAGAAIFSPAIARRMMTYFSQLQQRQNAYTFPELTEREREVLLLMAQHHTNKEIAQILHLSPKTVRNYTSNVFAKLRVADRAEDILRAQNAGFNPFLSMDLQGTRRATPLASASLPLQQSPARGRKRRTTSRYKQVDDYRLWVDGRWAIDGCASSSDSSSRRFALF